MCSQKHWSKPAGRPGDIDDGDLMVGLELCSLRTLYIPSTSLACESEDCNPKDSNCWRRPDSGIVRSDVTDSAGLNLHNPTSNNYSWGSATGVV